MSWWLVLLLGLVGLLGCSSKDTPAADGGADGGGDMVQPTAVDEARLGAECSFEAPCPSGATCFIFRTTPGEAVEVARCIVGNDACAVVTCPAGTDCQLLSTVPEQPFCYRR